MIHIFWTPSILIIGLLFATACNRNRVNFERGFIPTTPVNFADVNSEYDDYNSSEVSNFDWRDFYLIFSTNRASKGAQFDFIEYYCSQDFDQSTGRFRLSANNSYKAMYDYVNSEANEFGPYLENYSRYPYCNLYFASDRQGSLDIFRAASKDNIVPVRALNSPFDDAYPSIFYSESKTETIYFCSNRDKTFDIYQATNNSGEVFSEDNKHQLVQKNQQLSSPIDDKCPFVYKNTMVFVSNRPGGMGGFDLWYATFNGTSWSEPKNFGSPINTPYDEYRPILQKEYNQTSSFEFINDLMIFSSNRPGGKGGFDLYYVGIPKDLH